MTSKFVAVMAHTEEEGLVLPFVDLELELELTKPTGWISGLQFPTEKGQNTTTANDATLNTVLGVLIEKLSLTNETKSNGPVLSSPTRLLPYPISDLQWKNHTYSYINTEPNH